MFTFLELFCKIWNFFLYLRGPCIFCMNVLEKEFSTKFSNKFYVIEYEIKYTF